ncbi:MAG TPA: cupin domain-containing protein [Prosthecochloris aestuarii]|uniref:Cupin domain-containing protein n=1 Tax=Prosthecochloris aestuarii TaxID=1102 RepID=A0A831STA5_PROAE|nr:cupin domain-containing protein [Prosthecochloris aestuarii]
MPSADHWITALGLEQHPEGGYYRETYRSKSSFSHRETKTFPGDRSYATSIYYLLRANERSRLHRIRSDELWFFHAGSPLTVYLFHDVGLASSFTLSPKDGVLQGMVPANTWFGAKLQAPSGSDAYALASCVVSPGFDFRDFTFADPQALTRKFPQHKALINELS